MANNYLPHFYRIFSAKFLWTLFWLSIIILFIFTLLPDNRIYFLSPLSPFEKLKMAVLKNPQDPESRLKLAQAYEEVNDLSNAKRELFIGLNYKPRESGLITELSKIERIQGEPQRILTEIQKWEKITRDFPGYRDAYLKLTQLYYTLYQNDEARENLNKALQLDPNFEPSREIKEILRNK